MRATMDRLQRAINYRASLKMLLVKVHKFFFLHFIFSQIWFSLSHSLSSSNTCSKWGNKFRHSRVRLLSTKISNIVPSHPPFLLYKDVLHRCRSFARSTKHNLLPALTRNREKDDNNPSLLHPPYLSMLQDEKEKLIVTVRGAIEMFCQKQRRAN